MASALMLAIGCGGLAGCVSTQDKNARAQLVAQRTLDGRRPLRLGRPSRDVHVVRVSLVRGRHGGALVVALRNRGSAALTDVPIAVGVRDTGGRRVPLNRGRGLDWFQTHVPAIGAGESVDWVFTTRRELPDGRPWAVAGAVAGSVGGALPRIAAEALPASAVATRTVPRDDRRGQAVATRTVPRDDRRGQAAALLNEARAPDAGARRKRSRSAPAVRIALANESDIPQYGVQVYAVVRAGGRVVAAGKATVAHLGTHGRANARVALFGAPGRRTARVHALPTIFE